MVVPSPVCFFGFDRIRFIKTRIKVFKRKIIVSVSFYLRVGHTTNRPLLLAF